MGYSYPYRNNSSNKSSVPPITPVAPLPNIQLPITPLPIIPITTATSTSTTTTANDAANPNNKFKTFPNVKRKRTAQACNACRRKRIKCDGKSPCTPCIQHKTESECCFAPPLKRGPRKGSTRVNLKERLHKVEELLLKLTSKQNLDETNLELLTKSLESSKSSIGGKAAQATPATSVASVAPVSSVTASPSATVAANASSSLLSQKSLAASMLPNLTSTSTTPILPNPSSAEATASSLLNTNPVLAAAAASASTANSNSLLNAIKATTATTSATINNNKEADSSVQNLINQTLLNSLLLNQQKQAETLKNTPAKSTTDPLAALTQQQRQQLISNLSTANASQLLALASQNSLNSNSDLLNPQNQVNLLAIAALHSNNKLKNNLSTISSKNNTATDQINSTLSSSSSQITEANIATPANSPFPSALPPMTPSPKSLLEASLPLSPSLPLKNNKRKAKPNKRSNLSNKKMATSLYKDQYQDNIIDLTNSNTGTTTPANKLSSVNTINTNLEEEILQKKIKSIGKIPSEKNEIPYLTSNNSITIPSSWTNTSATNVPSTTSTITSTIYKNLMNNSKKEAEIPSNSASSSVSNLPFIKVSSQNPVVQPVSLLQQNSVANKSTSTNINVDLLKNAYNKLDLQKEDLSKDLLNSSKATTLSEQSSQQLKLQQLLQNSLKQLSKNGVVNEELLANNPLYNQLLLNSDTANSVTNSTTALNSSLGTFDISNPLSTTNINGINSSYVQSSTGNIDNILMDNNLSTFPLNSLPSTDQNSNENENNSNIGALTTKAKFNGLGQTKTSPLISQNGLTIPSDNTSLLIADKNINVGLDFLNTINNANSLNTLNINNLYRSKLLNSFNPLNPLNSRQGLNDSILMYNLNPELLQNYPFGLSGTSKIGENGIDNLLNNKPYIPTKNGTDEKKPDEKTYKGDLGVAFIDMKSSGGYIYFGNSSCVGLASNLINDLSSEKKSGASFSFNDLKNILASVSNRKDDDSNVVNVNSRVEDVTPITTKENFKKILDLFFDYLHPIIPLFNRQVFTSLLDNDPDAPGYQLLLHCILAVVGKYIPKEELPSDLPSDISQLAFDWSRNQLQKVFDIPSLPTVQALIILSTLAMSNPRSEMGYSTYTYTGTAVRMAHELGLHRDLMLRGQDHTLEEKNETRRAWVLLYVLDRQSALMTGRPMIIDDSDWDIPPPTIDSNEATEVEKATVQALTVRLELFEIVGEISRWSNAGKRKASQETDPLKKEAFVISHQKKLTDWRNSIPEYLQWSDPPYLYKEDNEPDIVKNEFSSLVLNNDTINNNDSNSNNKNNNNKLNFSIKMEKTGNSDTTNSESNSTNSELSKTPKDLVWKMFPLYLAAIYYRAQLTLHVYSLTSSLVTPTVLQSKKICASAAIYLTNIIISMMAITSEPHPLCSFFLAQLPTTIMTCISVQLFIVKSNNWSEEERHTATKAILNNIQLLKISKVQPLGTYLYAYAKWIVHKANIEINDSDLESIDAMNANTTSSNLKSIYSSIYSSSMNNKKVTNNPLHDTNNVPLTMDKLNPPSVSANSTPIFSTATTSSFINPSYLNETDPLSSTFKGKEVLNMENELINTANKDIPMTDNSIQDDAILNAYREALKHNDPFLTTMDFRDLMQEMNLEL